MSPNVLVLIPARYESSRFPGKPLAKLPQDPDLPSSVAGKSLIQLVAENCQELQDNSDFRLDYAVVTNHEKIEDHLVASGLNSIRVDDEVATGSERIYLAYERFYKDQEVDLIVNLQGDEPLFDKTRILKFINYCLSSTYSMNTLVKKRNDAQKNNENIVKALYEEGSKKCLYFSRCGIPFGTSEWYQHIGVYGYRPMLLESFFKAKAPKIEKWERLEQLRALSLGFGIGGLEIDGELLGVDTPQDLIELENYYRSRTGEMGE